MSKESDEKYCHPVLLVVGDEGRVVGQEIMYDAMIVSLFNQGSQPGLAIVVVTSVLKSLKELSSMQLIETSVKMQCYKFVTSGISQGIAVLQDHVLVAAQDLHHFRCQTWGCVSGLVEMQSGHTCIVL